MQDATIVKIEILGDDDELLRLSESPYQSVVGSTEPTFVNVG